MHDDHPTDPNLPADPGELTERHAVDGVTPMTPPGTTVERFAPAPESRPAWARWDAPATTTPERWYEPAASAAASAEPVAPTPVVPVTPTRPRRTIGTGSVVAAALVAAILASTGTVLVLGASGALDRPSPTSPTSAQGTNVGAQQPVNIDESSATIAVAAKVSPAVVKITVRGASDAGGIIPATGVGSGVIFDSNGWILTNHHVVEGGEQFDVELKDGRVLSGKVYGIDTLTDLAIVKVEETGLPAATLGSSDALKVGQLVVAIGSPLGTYSNSVTSGIVSAKGRSITTDGNDSLTNLIQTDAAINPGNSGGPLLDAAGNVVGINTAIASGSNGIGFAIPVDIAKPILAQALAGEELSRPYMGIRFQSITRKLADEQNLPVDVGAWVGGTDQSGALVPGVDDGTPAAQAGIEDGDIIVSVEGKVIDEEHPLDATLAQFSPGDTVSVEVLRDGQHLTVEVTLGTRPAGL